MATPQGKSRLLIKDWLIKQFDNEAYTSSRWIDRNQLTFCVPWTHQSRHEFDPEDARIFEDWSRVAGYWKPTESSAQWKTRFRCALTKSPYIADLKKEVLLTEGNQEKRCKVYQIINHKKNTTTTRLPASSTSQQHTVLSDTDVSLLDIPQHNVVGEEDNLDGVVAYLNQETDESQYYDPDTMGELYSELLLDNCRGVSFENIDLSRNLLLMPPVGQATAVATPETPHQQLSQLPETTQVVLPLQQLSEPRAIKPDVEPDNSLGNDDSCQVDILYFGQRSTTYRFAEKCHLYDRSDPDSVSGDLLPRLESMSKNKPEEAVKKARRILQPKNIKGGILIEYDKGDIWATRFCLDQIFFSNYFIPTSCTKLQRNERQQIFSQVRFDEAYKDFKKEQAKMPSNEVCLGFALPWYFSDRQTTVPISAIVKSRRNQWVIDKEPSLSEHISSLNISTELDAVRSNDARLPQQSHPLTPLTPLTSSMTLAHPTFPEVTDAQTSSSYALPYSPISPASSIGSPLSQTMSPMMPNIHTQHPLTSARTAGDICSRSSKVSTITEDHAL